MDLELARADRHLHPVSVASRLGERPGNVRLGGAVEAQGSPARRTGPGEDPSHRLGRERPGPERLKLPRWARKHHCHASLVREHECRGRAGKTHDQRTGRQRRLLSHAGFEVRIRPSDASGDPPGRLLDLPGELFVDVQRDGGGPREQLDRPVVVCRPESAGDAEQVVGQALGQRRLEVGRVVSDHGDPRRA